MNHQLFSSIVSLFQRKRGRFFLLLLPFFFIACSNKKTFRLRGTFENLQQADVFIYSPDGGIDRVDTLHIIEGEFDWKTPLANEAIFYIIFPNFSEQVIFARPGDVVKIEGNGNQLRSLTIQGNPENDELTEFRLSHLEDHPDSLKKAMQAFIKEKPATRVASYMQRQITLSRAVLSRLKVGQKLPDIVLPPDSLGGPEPDDDYKLPSSDNKDTLFINSKQKNPKPVLLIFWASWKRNSVDDFPQIRNILRNNKQIQPVSISLDYDLSPYYYNLRRDSIHFDRRCYKQVWQTPIVQQLSIRDLPYYILVDKQRHVLALGTNWKKNIEPAIDQLPKE
ncbi:MAG: DUF4369 domain-containing protein [Bacteroidaceae bacterium]|nr:DUF4369 domain-containing protein [Bacteroidaceae bacterium]